MGDWTRILLGETPPAFLVEVVLRTVFIFVLLLVSMRLIGHRMAAQLTRLEMLALFSLAAAIGVPLQAPDRGLLPALVIVVVVVAVGRMLAIWMFGNERFEARVSDQLTVLVADGVLNIKGIGETRLTIERVLAQLRSQGIRQLGEVQRLYIEAGGTFSLVKQPEPKPGLSVLPPMDEEFQAEQPLADSRVCGTCGHAGNGEAQPTPCPNCGHRQWVVAVA